MDLSTKKVSSPLVLRDKPAALALRRQVQRWFDSPLGRSLQATEARHLRGVLSRLYGTVAVQLGEIGKLDLMNTAIPPSRIVFDLEFSRKKCCVKGEPDKLPFDAKSIDVAVLPHTLDFTQDPHEVLREVYRVLSPEGHIVLLGFNPFSLWGIWRLFGKHSKSAPWGANFLALSRIKDWLALLGFELSHGKMLYYRPPIKKKKFRDRLAFVEKVGDRWWPMGAAVYMVVAKKRVAGMTPLQPVWQKKTSVVGGGLTEPAAKVIYPRVANWRLRRDT